MMGLYELRRFLQDERVVQSFAFDFIRRIYIHLNRTECMAALGTPRGLFPYSICLLPLFDELKQIKSAIGQLELEVWVSVCPTPSPRHSLLARRKLRSMLFRTA
jgi:hypothetical protein